MSEVDAAAEKSLSAWVKANCKHYSHKVAGSPQSVVCRPCAIDWATSGCYSAVLLEREACAKVAHAAFDGETEGGDYGNGHGAACVAIEEAIRARTLRENFS